MERKNGNLIIATEIEVLPPELESVRAPDDRMRRIAREEAVRLLAEEDIIAPWLTTPKVAQEIRRLQSVENRNKFAYFFESEGCLRCKRHTPQHAGNGLCLRCRAWFVYRLKHHMKKRRQRTQRGER